MVETYGPARMAALMAALADVCQLDDAIVEVYGISVRELDEEWRASVGASPLPEKAEAALPTPATPLPTLVPYSLTPVSGSDQLAPPVPTPVPTPDPTATPVPTTAPVPAVPPGPGGGCSAGGGPAAVDVSWVALLTILAVRPAIRLLRRR